MPKSGPLMRPSTACTECSSPIRSSNGLRRTNIRPWFDAAPLKLNPMTEKSAITSGSLRMMLFRPLRDLAGVFERRSRRPLHLDEEVAGILFGDERLRHRCDRPTTSARASPTKSSTTAQRQRRQPRRMAT